MNRNVAFGAALFLIAWALAAFAYEQAWVGIVLVVLAAGLVVWVTANSGKK
ncbi:MAG: hypothetical protein ACR2FJ_09255 [Qipengyuania sp.]